MKRKLHEENDEGMPDKDDEVDDGDDSDDSGNSINSAESDIEESDIASEEDRGSDQHEVSNKTGSKHKHGNHSGKTMEPASKIPRLAKGDLYKPPTNEELNQLKETENLFHSTLFRMQITELLSEVSLKSKRKREIENTVAALKAVLTELEKGPKYELQDISWLTNLGVKVPFKLEPAKVKGSFQFVPPADVKVSGSFLMDTCIKPHVTVDLNVVMPKAFFEVKDFLNQRFLRKRALYLAKLAAELTNSSVVEDMKFSYLHGNPLKPVLVLTAKVEAQKGIKMHIHAVPESGTFKLNRFHPEKNNVRSHWFNELEETENLPEKDVPTPFYNSTVLEDLTVSNMTETVEKVLSSSQSVKEGITLLKVWLRQRELDKGFGGFTGYVMTLYVCYLLSEKKVNSLMSSYQIFRNTLLKLSQSDWVESTITMCSDTLDTNMPSQDKFHEYFDVVFIDPTGYFNICYAMNRTMFQRVRHEAQLGMKILEDRSVDSFEKLFMKKVPLTLKFDQLFHSDLSGQIQQTITKLGLSDRIVDYGGARVHACLPALAVVLEKALGQRVHLLQLSVQEVPEWDVQEKPVVAREKIIGGLVLNSEFAFNVLDRGPSADSAEAEEFRRFWGPRSELRRFQDGGICEAVLWMNKANIAEKQLVCEHIVKYVLERHASILPSSVKYIGGQLDSILYIPVYNTLKDQTLYGTGEEQNVAVIRAYDDVCKILRRLTGLPLNINSIQGTSPCFRYTEVFPPLPYTFRHRGYPNLTLGIKRNVPGTDKECPIYIHALKVICTLEGSGKWPDDLEAMKRLKMAFHIQLAEAIKSQFNLPVKVGMGYVDVLKDHYVFRLSLAYNREIGLLKSVRSPDGKLLKRETEEALALERETVVLPRLTSTLHGLQQQHPSFSTTARLAKRWVSAHMLNDYIHPVAIELLVASLYLSPAPSQAPCSGLSGFQRFLEFLSTFDWKTTPLLINLNNEFTVRDLAEIPTKFSSERSTLPLMFISTPLDKYSNHWTKGSPTANILNRLVLLATRSLDVIQQQILSDEKSDLQQVFRPSLGIYDVVIHLNDRQFARRHEGLHVNEESPKINFGKNVDEDRFPVINFDPPRLLLNELKSTFCDLCLFFYDNHGGKVIGVLWKPSQLQPKEFKVSRINCSKVHTESSDKSGSLMLVPNLDAVLEDIKIIGKGLITKIELKDKKT